MSRQIDQADQWLAQNDPLYDLALEAKDTSEDVFNNFQMSRQIREGYVILEEEREEVANTLKN